MFERVQHGLSWNTPSAAFVPLFVTGGGGGTKHVFSASLQGFSVFTQALFQRETAHLCQCMANRPVFVPPGTNTAKGVFSALGRCFRAFWRASKTPRLARACRAGTNTGEKQSSVPASLAVRNADPKGMKRPAACLLVAVF